MVGLAKNFTRGLLGTIFIFFGQRIKLMRKDRVKNVIRIVKFIQENPNTHLREISRELGLNPATVHRILKEIEEFLVMEAVDSKVEMELPNLPVLIRLKEGVTPEGIIRFLKIKDKIKL